MRRTIAIALAGCSQDPCGDLAEGQCLARDDCTPVYRHGACDDCPPVFERCGAAGDAPCAGQQSWVCGTTPPRCAAPECVPSPDDPCFPRDEASCTAPECAWNAYTVGCRGMQCNVDECRPTAARQDCEEFDDDVPSCTERPDCVLRVRCAEVKAGSCDTLEALCRVRCEDDADCDPYESCTDDIGTGVPTCAANPDTCELLLSCS